MTASYGNSAYNQSPGGPRIEAPGAIDLYVAADAAGASDSNPGTIAQPLLTINEAIRRVNTFDVLTGLTTIHVAPAAANYTMTEFMQPKILRQNANWVIYGDGAGQGGDGFTVLSGPTAAVAGSSTVQVVRAAGLGVNTFRGKTIQITSGAANGDRRTIRDHTDTTIIPVRNFSAAVAAADTFRIVEPAVKITPNIATLSNTPQCDGIGGGSHTVQSITDISNGPPALCFIQLNFVAPTLTAASAMFSRSRVVWLGCEWAGAAATDLAFFIFDASNMFFGTQWPGGNARVTLGFSAYGATSITSWSGWGFYGAQGINLDGPSAAGFLVAGNVTGVSGFGLRVDFFHLHGGSAAVTAGTAGCMVYTSNVAARSLIGGVTGQADIAPAVNLVNTGAANACIDIDNAAQATQITGLQLNLNKCSMTSAGPCLRVRGPNNVQVGVAASVTGTGGTVGIDCQASAKVSLNGVTGILGPAGVDLTVDALATSSTAASLTVANAGLTNATNGAVITRFA